MFNRPLSLALSAMLAGCGAVSNGGLAPMTAGAPTSSGSLGLQGIAPANVRKIRRSDQAPPKWMRFRPNQDRLAYVVLHNSSSPFVGPQVNVYPKNNMSNSPPICYIGDWKSIGTVGVDFSGNLWIPQVSSYGNKITFEYNPQCGHPTSSIEDTDGQPWAVAFGPHRNVYVENTYSVSGPGTGANIDVLPGGQGPPSVVLKEPNAYAALGVALDGHSNVYMSWVDSGNVGHVDEFPTAQNNPNTLPMTTGYIGGVNIDSAGNLLVVDQTAGTIDVFARPYGSTPIATITLKGFSLQCSLNRLGRKLYCGDYQQGSVDVYAYNPKYPAKTTYDYSWTNGLSPSDQVVGVSLSPAARSGP